MSKICSVLYLEYPIFYENNIYLFEVKRGKWLGLLYLKSLKRFTGLFQIDFLSFIFGTVLCSGKLFSLCIYMLYPYTLVERSLSVQESISGSAKHDGTTMSRCKASVLFLIAPMSFTHPLAQGNTRHQLERERCP